MPWCPNCDVEYEVPSTRCAGCGAALTGEPPEKDADTRYVYANPVPLIRASSDIEADNIAALLDSRGIPVTRHHDGFAGYWKVTMGSTPMGVDLLVAESALDEAREALEATGYLLPEGEAPAEDDFDDPELEAELHKARQRKKALWVAALIGAPVLGWAVTLIARFIALLMDMLA